MSEKLDLGALERECREALEHMDGRPSYQLDILSLIARIRELEGINDELLRCAQSVGEAWVPVSERLPEATGDYLVYRPDAHRMPAADPTVCIRYYTPGANRGNDYWRGAHRVTHWMPLPPAPMSATPPTKEPK